MRVWALFFLVITYLVISRILFDNYWGLIVAIIVCGVILLLVVFCIMLVEDKRNKKKREIPFNKVLHQTEELESVIKELRSKTEDSEIQAVIVLLEEYIAESKQAKSPTQKEGLFEHILVSSHDEIEKSTNLESKKEYTIVNHLIKQLICGTDCHTICENLIRYGDAYEPEKGM